MTKLSRTSLLAGAQEATPYTYQAPTFAIPFTKADYETIQSPLRDESIRGNDAVLQGMYPGPSESTWDIEHHAYTDILGQWLRIIGPDTVVAGVSTTTTAVTAGASSLSTALTIPAGSVVRIDTAALTEYAYTGTPTGSGPFVIPLLQAIGGSAYVLKNNHASSTVCVTQTKHTFAQSSTAAQPRWSLSVYDNIDYRGWAGCGMSELAVKIDPKATITANPKFTGFPEAVVSSFTNTYNTGVAGPSQPELGWGWTLTAAGGVSTRGLSLDLTYKRATEAIHASNGTQAPREVFCGALELDGSMKAIYESTVEKLMFLNWSQLPVVASLTKALQFGGESLILTASQGGIPKFKEDLSQTYVQASWDLSAIFNPTDAGITTAVLNNWTSAQY